jgi:hypothetical protein
MDVFMWNDWSLRRFRDWVGSVWEEGRRWLVLRSVGLGMSDSGG